MKLTERQREVLEYLRDVGHATRSALRSRFEAVPAQALKVLAQRGYIEVEHVTSPASVFTFTRYSITALGRRALEYGRKPCGSCGERTVVFVAGVGSTCDTCGDEIPVAA